MKTRTLALVLAVAAIAACRGSSSDSPDAANSGIDSSSNADDTTIYDIQDPGMPPKIAVGAVVNIRGVVVTAIDTFGAKTGTFWVEEPGGGNYSGVLVFGASTTDVAALHVGDLVDVVGAQKAEFALSGTGGDTSGRTTTEMEPPTGGAMMVMKTGTGTLPDPVEVNALTIGQMPTQAAKDAEWEKYEGVLIKVSNVAAISNVSQIGGKTPDPTFQKFSVTGSLVVESSLAAFPTAAPKFGDCEASITGIGDYFFDWLLEPRSTDEIATGGTGCPIAEADSTTCGDGMDNDGNGHADCFDYSCDLYSGTTCVKGATINDIDTSAATAPIGGAVNVDGVYVIAVDKAKKNLWVSDSLAGATDKGVYVRGPSAGLDVSIVVGAKVNVDLTVILPFHGLMELSPIPGATTASPSVTVAGTAGVPSALTTTLATLSDTAMMPHYAGSLVSIGKAKVTAVVTTGTTTKHTTYTISDGTKTIELTDTIFDPALTMGACVASVTGVATLDTFPNPSVPAILPRSALDMGAIGAGNCP